MLLRRCQIISFVVLSTLMMVTHASAQQPGANGLSDPSRIFVEPGAQIVNASFQQSGIPRHGVLPVSGECCDTCGVDGCADGCGAESCCDIPDGCGDGCGLGCGCNSCKEGHWTDYLCGDKLLLGGLRGNELFCSGWTYSAGGALRYRYLHEQNRLRPPGPGLSSYDQWRFTPFLDLNYGDRFTARVEAIDAETFNEDLATLPIDENEWDLLQAYVDVKVADLDGGPLRFRYGRQTLLYGGQHLVSPLAWANTFRNFEGFKAYYQGEDWNVDAFAVQPVNGAARGAIFNVQQFDTPDQSVWFSGIYSTYKKFGNSSLDLYWLWYNQRERRGNRQDGNRHTIGARINGKRAVKVCDEAHRTWAWDLEAAYQFGEDNFLNSAIEENVGAGFIALDLNHTWNKVPWSPNVKGLLYYGSGDPDPTDGQNNTVFTQFPLGHAYWGLIDQFSGQNLVDYSLQASVKPMKKLTLLGAYHYFDKAHEEDFIYNIAGAPLGANGAAGLAAGQHIGSEFDIVATYAVSKNLTLQAGYFWFWYGDAVQNTGLNRNDARQFYFLANYQF